MALVLAVPVDQHRETDAEARKRRCTFKEIVSWHVPELGGLLPCNFLNFVEGGTLPVPVAAPAPAEAPAPAPAAAPAPAPATSVTQASLPEPECTPEQPKRLREVPTSSPSGDVRNVLHCIEGHTSPRALPQLQLQGEILATRRGGGAQ